MTSYRKMTVQEQRSFHENRWIPDLKPVSNSFFSAMSFDRRARCENENGTSSIPKTGDLTGVNSASAIWFSAGAELRSVLVFSPIPIQSRLFICLTFMVFKWFLSI